MQTPHFGGTRPFHTVVTSFYLFHAYYPEFVKFYTNGDMSDVLIYFLQYHHLVCKALKSLVSKVESTIERTYCCCHPSECSDTH